MTISSVTPTNRIHATTEEFEVKILKRLGQPAFGAAIMLGLVAGIELGQVIARLYTGGAGTLLESNRAMWMLVSVLIAGMIAWRLFRYPMTGRPLRRTFIVVFLHAAGCWRFLSIELAILATLPVFALAAALWLGDDARD